MITETCRGDRSPKIGKQREEIARLKDQLQNAKTEAKRHMLEEELRRCVKSLVSRMPCNMRIRKYVVRH